MTTETTYIIVVAPMTYYVAEGHFTRDRKRAMRFDAVEDAKETIDIRAAHCGWKAVEN